MLDHFHKKRNVSYTVFVDNRTASAPLRRAGQVRTQRAASRRRGDALEDAILGAAWSLLADGELADLTIESVARQAQTSRSVVYRRWPTRRDLIQAAVVWQHAQRTPEEIPDTGSLRGDMLEVLTVFSNTHGEVLMAALLQLATYLRSEGSSIDDLRTDIFRDSVTASMPTVLMRAQQRGEINIAGVPQDVLNLPMDLLRSRMITSHHAPGADDVAAILDDIYFPLLRAYGALGE